MQQPLPVTGDDAMGQQDADLSLAVCRHVGDQFHRGPDETTVRALDEVERKAREPELGPLRLELRGPRTVQHEVDRTQLVRVEHPRVLQRAGVREVQPVDEDEHDVTAEDRGYEGLADVLLQLLALLLVLLVEPDQGGHEDDEEHDHDPDAFAELHDDEDQHDAERQHPGKAVDGELVPPPLLP